MLDAVAKRAILIINTFNAQTLVNTVNNFSKISHDNTDLFNNVVTSTIPIINTYNAQELSNTIK